MTSVACGVHAHEVKGCEQEAEALENYICPLCTRKNKRRKDQRAAREAEALRKKQAAEEAAAAGADAPSASLSGSANRKAKACPWFEKAFLWQKLVLR